MSIFALRSLTPRTRPATVGLVTWAVLAAPSSSARPQPPEAPPASAPARLAPPPAIIELLESGDSERRVEGFSAWYDWRSKLPTERKAAARAFISQPRWLDALGDEVLYDMTSAKRRLVAYSALGRIGGSRVFPWFLWGVDASSEGGVLFFRTTRMRLADNIRKFFKKHGDPTVLEHLPEWQWMDVRAAIQDRWSDREDPEPDWTPISPGRFTSDLMHRNPAQRRLAVRAITVNRRAFRSNTCVAFRPLLSDADPQVVATVVEAMTIVSCPDARGRLKAIARDDAVPLETRRTCLRAIVRCRTAPEWTAEWMIESLSGWPPEFDETVTKCLRRLRPRRRADRARFAKVLERALQEADDPRIKSVIEGAIIRD